jgi:hypothetical protein
MLIRYFIGIRPSPPAMQALSPKFTAVSGRRLFYRDISFLDWISTFIYKEIYEKFQQELITGMNPKASFGNRFRCKLRGIKPSTARDCFP